MRIYIKKKHLEFFLVNVILILSLFSPLTLSISVFLSLLYLIQKEVGAIKILSIFAIRTIINPGIATSFSSIQLIKTIIIMLLSLYLMLSFFKLTINDKKKIRTILIPIIVYSIYSIFSSLFFSNLPIIAITKVINYAIPFLGMIVGVIYTKSKYNWLDWIFILFLLIFLYSIPLFNFSIGFLRTGTSFQGITNQPNMLGVIMVLFSSIIFSKLSVAKRKWYLWMILIFVFVQIYFTYSRTSMFSFLILLIVFLYFNLNIQKKFLYVIIFGVFLLFISVFQINIYSQIIEYVYKGQDFILESRFNQVEDLIFNFRKNPIFGTGFSVPHVMQRSYEFNFSYIVEPGNLILAVLSYGGLIGLILFIYAMLKIYLANKYNMHIYIYVFISTLLVSMGELVFFSTNNIAILLYLQIAIYIVSNHNFIKRRDKDVM